MPTDLTTPVEFDALPKLPYWTQIRGPLFEIITAAINKMDRERSAELEARSTGLRVWLQAHVRVARHTYEVIEALAHDRKQLCLGLEIAVVVPPLARVILESVFSLMYVFDDPSKRLADFWQGAWRKLAEQYDEYTKAYGSDPAWQPWLTGLAAQRDGWRDELAKHGTPLSAQQLADWEQAPWWPTPGKMRKRCTDPWRQTTLGYLDVRYYGPLSIATHLSGTGLMVQAATVLPNSHVDNQRKYFSDQCNIALAMLMSLLSVYAIEVIHEPAFARRLVALWQSTNLPGATTEVFNICFRAKLEALAGS